MKDKMGLVITFLGQGSRNLRPTVSKGRCEQTLCTLLLRAGGSRCKGIA